ncbi:MAG: hypothetical protein ACKKMW_02165 [Candidatus Nealsonbacteria bacterium]
MRKTNLQFKLSVSMLREGKRFIAYTPTLDLSTSGKSYKEAKKRFIEIVNIFFEELVKKGTLKEVLQDLGWKKSQKEWVPPILISQESETVQISMK